MKTKYLLPTIIFSLLYVISVGTKISLNQPEDKNIYLPMSEIVSSNDYEQVDTLLAHVLTFAEKNKLTSGNTSVLLQTDDDDIGIWYNNLKNTYNQFQKNKNNPEIAFADLKTSIFKKYTNHLKIPSGLGVYPYNKLMSLFQYGTFLAGFVFFMLYAKNMP